MARANTHITLHPCFTSLTWTQHVQNLSAQFSSLAAVDVIVVHLSAPLWCVLVIELAVFLLPAGAEVQRVYAGCVWTALLSAVRMASMTLGCVEAHKL